MQDADEPVGEPAAAALRRLLAAHATKAVDLRLTACIASENQPGGAPPSPTFTTFQQRLQQLQLDHLEILPAPMTLDVAYLGQAVLAGEDDVSLMERIHAVLFPAQSFALQDALRFAPPGQDAEKTKRKWRNRLLDVQALWCHLHHGGDVFVTTDVDFLSNRRQLAQLGASMICTRARLWTTFPSIAAPVRSHRRSPPWPGTLPCSRPGHPLPPGAKEEAVLTLASQPRKVVDLD
ncbi:hypothetical protein HS041_28455 [Planomonospora sp. ID67723]|uniref:hypothetical protein n=1 Tax=Planomonospora sp. ID67723 TaxID=2738134 RepID=UPI0018C379FD|nr:hypothetical protein [Planomonospora sp. ID67723]MBG0831666.1 hypothetical protein [Planomonospora sp. ID67723]